MVSLPGLATRIILSYFIDFSSFLLEIQAIGLDFFLVPKESRAAARAILRSWPRGDSYTGIVLRV